MDERLDTVQNPAPPEDQQWKARRRQRLVTIMTADHRYMEELTTRLRELVRRHDWDGAGATCVQLEDNALRHQSMEDRLLFPLLLETADRDHQRVLAELSLEHAQLKGIIRQVSEAVHAAPEEKAGIQQEVARLTAELEMGFISHVGKEERMLYGWLDLILCEDEVEDLVEQIQSAP